MLYRKKEPMRLLPKHRVGFLNGFARDGFLGAAAHGRPIRCDTLSRRNAVYGRMTGGCRKGAGQSAEGDPEPTDRQRPDGLSQAMQAMRPPSKGLHSTTAVNHESGKKDE